MKLRPYANVVCVCVANEREYKNTVWCEKESEIKRRAGKKTNINNNKIIERVRNSYG